jgi:hypothetical protein
LAWRDLERLAWKLQKGKEQQGGKWCTRNRWPEPSREGAL